MYVRACCALAVLLGVSTPIVGATLLVPSQYLTIQDAINDAVDGDEILVSPGTYAENIDFLTKDLDLIATDGPATTTIAGFLPDQPTVRMFYDAGVPSLEGFTVTGGESSGVHMARVSFATGGAKVSDCVITGNVGRGVLAFGISVDPSRVTVSGCNISYNSEGGVYAVGATFTACTIEWNTGGNGGGGFFSSCELEGCLLSNNTASRGGGAICTQSTITGCEVSYNTASEDGGGLFIGGGSVVSCLISNNTAGAEGGGVSGNSSIVDTTIQFNTAAVGGGGSGIGMLAGCDVVGNTATDNGGGLAAMWSWQIFQSTLSGNSAPLGGALSLTGASPLGRAQMQFVTIADNSATVSGGAIWSLEGQSSGRLDNCILWGNSSPGLAIDAAPGTELPFLDDCIVDGGYSGPGTGIIVADPLFTSGPLGAYYLAPGSPARDASTSPNAFIAGTTDVAGGVDLPPLDLGRHYLSPYSEVLYLPGDCNADGEFSISDPVQQLGVLFLGWPAPDCEVACDVNDDSSLDLSDAVYFLGTLYSSGPLPARGGSCRPLTDHTLDCPVGTCL